MPNVNDIASIAEAMQKCPVSVVRDRCVAVRNRNASCRRCARACPADAVDVSVNELRVDALACVGCGACAAACPTEALRFVDPDEYALAAAAASSADANGGIAVIACARIASKRLASDDRFAEVPCLALVDESLPVRLVAHGASGVVLVDGDCSTCKHRATSRETSEAAAQANALIAAHGRGESVERVTSFPEWLLEGDVAERGSSRRAFFSEAAGAARETALAAARVTVAQDLGLVRAADEPAIGERLRVGEDGSLPRIGVPRHDAAVNALYELGEPVVEVVESRLFGRVDIDLDTCNACGMCAAFCPTGALRREASEKAGDTVRELEFSASACVQCGLCADVCWKGALTLSPAVPAGELYDFEPRVFRLNPAVRRKSPFSF